MKPQRPRPLRLLTTADLAAMPTDLPSGSVKYELDNGRLVVMAPPAGDHGRMQHRVGIILFTQAESRGLGEAFGEIGVILRRNPDRVVGPDAAFVVQKSLPVRMSPEGYFETIPELVVEIRSKNDSLPQLRDKAQEHLQAGVKMVWVIDSVAKVVTVFRRGKTPAVLQGSDTLTAAAVIPGFKLPVAELFRE